MTCEKYHRWKIMTDSISRYIVHGGKRSGQYRTHNTILVCQDSCHHKWIVREYKIVNGQAKLLSTRDYGVTGYWSANDYERTTP